MHFISFQLMFILCQVMKIFSKVLVLVNDISWYKQNFQSKHYTVYKKKSWTLFGCQTLWYIIMC